MSAPEHAGFIRVGVTYMCARCAAGAELRHAIERNDGATARFIAAAGAGMQHAPECAGARTAADTGVSA